MQSDTDAYETVLAYAGAWTCGWKDNEYIIPERDKIDRRIVSETANPKLPKEKQTLFFSATMPDTIVTLTKSLLKNPVKIYITPKSSTVDSSMRKNAVHGSHKV